MPDLVCRRWVFSDQLPGTALNPNHMPIYMDRHDVSENVTAEVVAQLHQADLEIQHLFNCKGLTYWFDGKRKTAFCLIEAPNMEAIKIMHEKAHGDVPHRIIEVDDTVVESFLGRIEDPEKSRNTQLNIINDPAFRTIMVVRIKHVPVQGAASNHPSKKDIQTIVETINKHKGRLVKQKANYFLGSFDSVTNAVQCALEIEAIGKIINDKHLNSGFALKIGLSAGVPVTEKEGIFEDTIKIAERLCDVVIGRIIITSEVKDLYESENLNISINTGSVNVLSPEDEKFITALMDYIDKAWNSKSLTSDRINKELGYSKSKLYRSMIPLTGKSLNSFIKEYKLNKALLLLNSRTHTIAEIAFETGFNSPAYFTKEFRKRFNLLPTDFARGFRTSENPKVD